MVSVSSKIYGVIKKLRGGKSVKYENVFYEAQDRSELVATFLAVLELIKGKRVRIEGEGSGLSLTLVTGRINREDDEDAGGKTETDT